MIRLPLELGKNKNKNLSMYRNRSSRMTALVVHCTTPESAIYVDYDENGAPRDVQTDVPCSLKQR